MASKPASQARKPGPLPTPTQSRSFGNRTPLGPPHRRHTRWAKAGGAERKMHQCSDACTHGPATCHEQDDSRAVIRVGWYRVISPPSLLSSSLLLPCADVPVYPTDFAQIHPSQPSNVPAGRRLARGFWRKYRPTWGETVLAIPAAEGEGGRGKGEGEERDPWRIVM